MPKMTPSMPKTPAVWAVCNYPAHSGGASAFNGVARLFAARTGLELHSIDALKIIADFQMSVEAVLAHLPHELRPEPATGHPHMRSLLQRAMQAVASEVFIKAQENTMGVPQAMLMSFDHRFITTYRTSSSGEIHLQIPKRVFTADQLDIMHWCRYLPKEFDNLAPHNLTTEILAAEADRFRQALKGDGRPLIAIVIGDDGVSNGQMAALGTIAAQMPDARFVISSSPRSSEYVFAKACEQLKALLNQDQQRHLLTYSFHDDHKNANPYKALLTLADHMIIIGQSESMVSERLFAGRTVYYAYRFHPPRS